MQSDRARLLDMLSAARAVMSFIEGRTRADLDSDIALQSAVYWQLCILGEAAAAVSEAGRSTEPGIEWRNVISLRNRLIHGYDSVENDIVWDVAARFLPPLVDKLGKLGLEQNQS